jgi:hypothetical protein
VACIKTVNDIVTAPNTVTAQAAVTSTGRTSTPPPTAVVPPATVQVEVNAATRSVAAAHQAVRRATSIHAVEIAVTAAADALAAARRRSAPAGEIRTLESSLRALRAAADGRIRSLRQQEDAQRLTRIPETNPPILDATVRPRDAIDEVLAARAVPVDVDAMLTEAMANPQIDDKTRDELPGAMSKVQRVSSHAPGLATETIAGLVLGRSSAPKSGGTLWASTVRSGGHANGYAYEIIAAARFIDKARTPGNGGRPVRIVAGQDELIFGQKLPAGPDRLTVEADTLIVKPGGYKVAIDAKAYSRRFGVSSDLRAELDGIKHAIRQGEVNEFHFASRGPLTEPAKALIEAADQELRAELTARVLVGSPTISELQSAILIDPTRPLICWHENLG